MTSLPPVLLFLSTNGDHQLNNEIRELEIQEQKEIEAVLASLSNQTAPHIEELHMDMALLAQLDSFLRKLHFPTSTAAQPQFSMIRLHQYQGRTPPITGPEKSSTYQCMAWKRL